MGSPCPFSVHCAGLECPGQVALNNAIRGLPVPVVGPAPPGISLQRYFMIVYYTILYTILYVCYIAYDIVTVYDIQYMILYTTSYTTSYVFLLMSERLTSLACDADCALKTQHRPPAIPRPTMWICARTFLCTDHLFDPMTAHSSKICSWRGPCWPQTHRISGGMCSHCTCNTPSSSPLGSNEKLSCCTKIGTVMLSDRPTGGLHSWLVRRQCLWTATTALF
jgi:hypothetical protein